MNDKEIIRQINIHSILENGNYRISKTYRILNDLKKNIKSCNVNDSTVWILYKYHKIASLSSNRLDIKYNSNIFISLTNSLKRDYSIIDKILTHYITIYLDLEKS